VDEDKVDEHRDYISWFVEPRGQASEQHAPTFSHKRQRSGNLVVDASVARDRVPVGVTELIRWRDIQSPYTGGATENKEDKNLYKQVIRLLKN
jgi:hypothetical protein